ncbi:MAG: hypothetical protein LBV04_05100 [Deferribacteraceae bacterium]|jgi:ADP-ribose pyrophosphatase YjhB (NUDIX family)|nr:hypothetical protein [Deferribacteraceae bacterium]
MDYNDFLADYNPSDYDRPSVAVDTVVFGISKTSGDNYRKLDAQQLSVLLVKRREHPFIDALALPGGFVAIDEALDAAACRVLHAKAGLQGIYLEQLYTYGELERDPRMRILSSAHVALVDRAQFQSTQLIAAWYNVSLAISVDNPCLTLNGDNQQLSIPLKADVHTNGKLQMMRYIADSGYVAFDHAQIIVDSLLRLRNKVDYTDIAFNLVSDEFTISELQQVYETILGETLLPAAFRRKIAGKIEETGGIQQEKGHRPSKLYRYRGNL